MSRKVIISVAPAAGGWSVVVDDGMQSLMFRSGARAEAQAKALARVYVGLGDEVHVRVHDRAQTLVGETLYTPA